MRFSETLRQLSRQLGLAPGFLRSELPERLGIPSFIQPDLAAHWQRVLSRSQETLRRLPSPAGPRVALMTTVSKGVNTSGYVAVMAYALRLRGADPFIIYCDGNLQGCERFTVLQMSAQELIAKGPADLCRTCYPAAERLYRVLGLPVHPMSEFLTDEGRTRVDAFVHALRDDDMYRFAYRGFALGPQVEATVARFQFSHAPDLQEPNRGIARRYAHGAVATAEAMLEMHRRLSPDILVHHFGAYVTRGTAWLVSKSMSKRSMVWARGETDGAMMLGKDANPVIELADRTSGAWNDLKLTSEQETRLDRLLADKTEGRFFTALNRDAVDSRESLLKTLKLDPAQPIVSLFTNCGFDSKLFYDTPLYQDVISWTCDTIELFRGRKIQLVIRVHPYEKWSSVIEQTGDRIAERYPVLPDNVRVVPAESKASSYVLAQMSRAVLLYGSALGIELSAVGKPVIVTGRGAYWHKGFTHDVHTRDEYAAALDQLEEIARSNPERTKAARRFAYYYYFMRQIVMHQWNHDMRPGGALRAWWKTFRTLEDLRPGADANLDALCRQVLEGDEAVAEGSVERAQMAGCRTKDKQGLKTL